MIDMIQAVDLLEQCVVERGFDYMYPPSWTVRGEYSTCLYARDGKPDCIIGLALAKSGMPVEVLQTLGGNRLAGLYSAHRLPIDLTLGALAVLSTAQRVQDEGHSWGVALRQATLIAGRYFDVIPRAVVADAIDRYRVEICARDSCELCRPCRQG
jgi:hypothetical protein